MNAFHERSGGEFPRHEHIAENSNALTGDHRLDGMKLLPEAQVLDFLEFGHVAPFAPCGCKPSLPCGRIAVRLAPNRHG